MLPFLGLSIFLYLPSGSQDAFNVSARIAAAELAVGAEYEIVVEYSLEDGHSASSDGAGQPILQIKAPKSVKLVGKVAKTPRDLARNGLLDAPYERFLSENPARVRFKLLRKPEAEDAFSLNVLAYVHSRGGSDATFVRRRLVLPVQAGASATEAEPAPSDWGTGRLLQLGDKAPGFVLPQADRTKVKLRDYLGKKNVVVTTYRAFW